MVSIIIPSLNPGDSFTYLLDAVKKQSLSGELIVIDSLSSDNTVECAISYGAKVIVVKKSEFNHGGTRNLAAENSAGDILIYMTQDAVLVDEFAFEKLIACFCNERVGAAYGRQLPRSGAHPIEAHARIFNYPTESKVKSMSDAHEMGIKTAFISNSFAAYRRKALEEVGGFPPDTVFGEDTYVAAKMLMAGWKVAYSADASVYHSHSYGFFEEFKRYFDIGVFHSREVWIRQNFGQAEGEGLRYIKSELNYLWNKRPQLIPSAVLRTLFKFIGYKLGASEKNIPLWLKQVLSMNRLYWESETKRDLKKC